MIAVNKESPQRKEVLLPSFIKSNQLQLLRYKTNADSYHIQCNKIMTTVIACTAMARVTYLE